MRSSISTRTIVWVTIVAVVLTTAFAGYSPSFAGGATPTPVVNDNGNGNGPAPTVETPKPADTAVPPAPTEIAATAVPATPVTVNNPIDPTASPEVAGNQPTPSPVVVKATQGIVRPATTWEWTGNSCDIVTLSAVSTWDGVIVKSVSSQPQSYDWRLVIGNTVTFRNVWITFTGDQPGEAEWTEGPFEVTFSRPSHCVEPTVAPTNTSVSPTETDVPPSATPSATNTNTPQPTNTLTVTPSSTPLPSATPTYTETKTSTPVPPTFTATYTATATATHTETPTAMPTYTYTPSQTPLAPTATQQPPVVEVQPSATPNQPTVEPTSTVVAPQGQPDYVRMVTNWVKVQGKKVQSLMKVFSGGSEQMAESMELSPAQPTGKRLILGKINLPISQIQPNSEHWLVPQYNEVGQFGSVNVVHNGSSHAVQDIKVGDFGTYDGETIVVTKIEITSTHNNVFADAFGSELKIYSCRYYSGHGGDIIITFQKLGGLH